MGPGGLFSFRRHKLRYFAPTGSVFAFIYIRVFRIPTSLVYHLTVSNILINWRRMRCEIKFNAKKGLEMEKY